MRILIILTAASERPSSRSLSLDQIVEAYYALQDSGTEVVIASSQGQNPAIPAGRERLTQQAASVVQRFQSDRSARDAISDTLKIEQVYPEDFDGAICIGVLEESARTADTEVVSPLLKELLRAGKPVAIVPNEVGLAPPGSFESLLIAGDKIRAPSLAAKTILAALNQTGS
jgi:hypothetical protein